MKKKLYKSSKHKMLFGVCGGIAEYFKIDPTIVRLIAVVLGLIKGAGVILYILAAIIMPYSDSEIEESVSTEDDVENLKSANIKKDSEKTPHTDEEFESFFKKSK